MIRLVTVLTCAAMLGLASAPKSSATTRPVRVVTHNIAGGHVFEGRLAAIDAAVQQARTWRPDVVMLQEVCKAQARAFGNRLPGYHYRFTVMRRHNSDCGGSGPRFGHLLASRWPLSDVTRINLRGAGGRAPGDPVRYFWLTCALVASVDVPAGRLRACVTHLRAHRRPEDNQARKEQVHRIRRALHQRIVDGPERVVVAGDFNARPQAPVLDEMYELKRTDEGGGAGDFVEGDQTDRRHFPSIGCEPRACRSGEVTVPGPKCVNCKFDYVFFSAPGVSRLSGRALDVGESDHKLYRASARLSF
jgi:endonuclease/exonuclease/phosphatase family metal-dependent hydrolase